MSQSPSPPVTLGSLGRASALAAAATALLQVGTFLTLAVLCHQLNPIEVGIYRQVLILQALPTVLISLGLPEVLLYQAGRAASPQERQSAYTAACLQLLLLIPAQALASGGLTALMGQVLETPALTECAWAAAWLGGLNSILVLTAAIFLEQGQPSRFLVFALFQLLFGVGLTWVLTTNSPELETALLAAILTAGLGAVLTLLALPISFRGVARQLWPDHILPGLCYGLPIAVGGFFYLVGYQMDHLTARLCLSAADYALYAAGAWQLPLGLLIHHAHATTLLSVLAGYHADQHRQAFWDSWQGLVRPGGIAGAVLFWGVFWSAEDVIRLTLGAAYDSSAQVFRCYALALPLRAAAVYLPLRAAGHTRQEYVAGLLLGLVSLGVGLLLGPRLGLVGPALGMVAGMAAWNGYLLTATCRTLNIPLTRLLPVTMFLLVLAGAGLLAYLAFQGALFFGSGPSLWRFGGFWGCYTLLALPILWLVRRAVLSPAAGTTDSRLTV